MHALKIKKDTRRCPFLFCLAERAGLFGFRVASAKASSLATLGTAFGILRERCSLVEPELLRPHTLFTK
jgi:hypothetical protein